MRLSRLLCWFLLVLTVVAPTTAAAQTPNPRFGAVDAFYDAPRADEIGVQWTRLMFPWQRVQRVGPNEWWPAISEDIINSEVRRGRKIAGVLVNTPDWASNGTGRHLTSPPKGLDLPVDDPNNYWAAYVRRSAAAYRGRVDTWIVWNEPDVTDLDHPGYTWSGTVEEFYRLQKVAYIAARQGNPNAKVVLPGLTYWWDKRFDRPQYFQRLLDVAVKDPDAQANGWFFDAAVLQLYNEPQLLYDVPNEFRKIMQARGIDKPIWINETNVAPWDDLDRPLTRQHFRGDQGEQASYLVQGYAMALAAGVERIAVYKLRDDDEWHYGWESYGVVRADHTIRPGGRALQMMHKLFGGVTGGSVLVQNGAKAVVLQAPDMRITVVWARGARPVTVRLQAAAGTATVYNREGVAREMTPNGGWYQLDLPRATHNTAGRADLYQIGGPPWIVVERGASGPLTWQVVDGEVPPPYEPFGLLSRALETIKVAGPAFR